MFFGNDGFFGRIHAADGGAIIIPAIRISGTHTLDEGDPFRNGSIRGPEEMAAVRSGGAQESFKLNAGYDIGIGSVTEFLSQVGIKDLIAW
jgi:hypothetical protein